MARTKKAKRERSLKTMGKKAGFIFGHFLGVFLVTTPHLENVTGDHRHSRILADFPSVGELVSF